MMTCCSRVRHALVVPSVRLAVAGALIYAGVVAAPAMAASYPPPGGIYAPFTDCPIKNRIMRQSPPGDATGCIASVSTSGTFTINGIPVAITHPVIVQFGVWSDSTHRQPGPPAGARAGQKQGTDLRARSDSERPARAACARAAIPPSRSCVRRPWTRDRLILACRSSLSARSSDFGLTTFTLPVKISLDKSAARQVLHRFGQRPDRAPSDDHVGELGIRDPTRTRSASRTLRSWRSRMRWPRMTPSACPSPRAAAQGVSPTPRSTASSGCPRRRATTTWCSTATRSSPTISPQSDQAKDLLEAFLASVGVPPASPSGAFLD